MAIEHSLLIKGEILQMDYFLDYCADKCINFKVQDDKLVCLYEWGMNVYFTKSTAPYNIWESDAFGMDFQYDTTVSFRLGKDSNCWEAQRNFVINYVFDVMATRKQEALFLYNTDTELCYFKADGSREMNDSQGILKNTGKEISDDESIN